MRCRPGTATRVIALAALLATALAGPARAADTLDAVAASGVLRWGSDAQGGAPYVYKDRHSLHSYIGFEVELADALAEAMGVRAARVQNQWDKLLPGLDRGDYDIALNGLEMTQEREETALFSRPYYVSALEVAVLKGKPGVGTIQGIRKMKVAVLKESFVERILKEAGVAIGSYENPIEAYLDLRHHNVDAVVMDAPIARYYGRGPDIEPTPADFGEARYGIAARKGEKRLIDAIDTALGKLMANGKLRKIYERYGVWNAATAELIGDPSATLVSEPEMLAEFTRPMSFRDRLHSYREAFGDFTIGAIMTLSLSVVGMAIAIPLGLLLALLRLYGPGPLRMLAVVYIEAIRGTPLFIQLLIIFYALPDLGVNLPPFVAAVLGLGLNYAAYEAENYRAGLSSIALGQSEAAHALGLTHMQTLRYVIVPQALRLVIPPVTNDFIALLKDSSIVSVIAMTELTETYIELQSATGDRIGLGLMVAAFYFVLGWPFAKLAAKLEERAREGRR